MTAMTACGISLAACCQQIGISYRHGKRLLAAGTFPIPELPRLGRTHRYSTVDVHEYLATAATSSVRPKLRRVS